MATNQSGKPTQLLITSVVSGSSVVVDTITDQNSAWYGYPVSFQVDLNVTPQTHSDATTPTPFYYGAGDIDVNDYLLQPSGKAYKITSIISISDDSAATVVIEDVESYILLGDVTGQGANYPDEDQPGLCVELDADGMPVISGIAQMSGSLPNVGYWIDDATSRFEATGAPAIVEIGINTSVDLNKRSIETSADGDSTEIAITYTPFSDSSVAIKVNGIEINLGDGVKTEAAYFSNDGGTTAKAIANVEAGDILHWNGSIAGYQLDATDDIDISYQKSSLY